MRTGSLQRSPSNVQKSIRCSSLAAAASSSRRSTTGHQVSRRFLVFQSRKFLPPTEFERNVYDVDITESADGRTICDRMARSSALTPSAVSHKYEPATGCRRCFGAPRSGPYCREQAIGRPVRCESSLACAPRRSRLEAAEGGRQCRRGMEEAGSRLERKIPPIRSATRSRLCIRASSPVNPAIQRDDRREAAISWQPC